MSLPWTDTLANFLRAQPSIEGLRIDTERRKVSIATLGEVDLDALEASLLATVNAVENRLGDKIVSGVESTLVAVAADPQHPLRKRYDEAVEKFVANLRENPDTIARAEQIKLDVLNHPGVAEFSREVWGDVKSRLASYAEKLADETEAEPDQLERWLGGLGQKVLEDPALAAKVNGWVVELVTYSVEQAREEVATLIATTVAAWDADATSRKIELQIGRDLQFIRINGTLVGGLVGLLLYVLGQALA
jgi:uncharacterized membrane-anchored protein YjiN (DUF445 family)